MPENEAAAKDSAKELMGIMETWVRAEAENTVFIVKEHARGRDALTHLADKIVGMLNDFIVEDKVPKINVVSKERLKPLFPVSWNPEPRPNQEAVAVSK